MLAGIHYTVSERSLSIRYFCDMTVSDNATVHLLWTGGWDSTFRLCDLILVHGKQVQPYYIIDPRRASFRQETDAMDAIRKKLLERVPDGSDRLLALKTFNLNDIPANESISERYESLKQRFGHVGSQFEWLPLFVNHAELSELEFSIEKNERSSESSIWVEFRRYIDKQQRGYIMRKENAGDFEIFRNFSFPLLYSTKLEMRRYSIQKGFYDILSISWFCHSPRNGKPCGTCAPCTLVMKEGFAYRLPLSAKIRWWKRRLKAVLVR